MTVSLGVDYLSCQTIKFNTMAKNKEFDSLSEMLDTIITGIPRSKRIKLIQRALKIKEHGVVKELVKCSNDISSETLTHIIKTV